MTKLIIFTDEELKDLINNKEVRTPNYSGGETVYMSREAYEEFIARKYRFGLDA